MAIPHRVQELWAYWRTEQRTLRQGFVALVVSTGAAFVAGLTLGSITGTLEAMPGLLILIPASVGMRGTIFGAIGARLGTAIHAGLFEANLKRDGVLRRHLSVGVIMTLTSSVYLAALTKLVSEAFGMDSISFADLVTISVVGAVLASIVLLFVTLGIAVLSFRRGWDLDAVSTPMVTAVGDMVTLPALFLAASFVRNTDANTPIAILCVSTAAVAAVYGLTTRTPGIRRTLAELAAVALVSSGLDILAGTVAESRLNEFVALPALLLLVPPFVSQAGALGGILAARLGSKLRLGVITPRGLPEAPAGLDALLVVTFGMLVFLLMGGASVATAAAADLAGPGALAMVGGTLVGGLMATALAVVAGYYLAVGTTRFGLDPDNHGVPMITSVMDLSGIVCLLFAMSLFGVS